MPWLRMLFKNKIKVYAQVDDHYMPIVEDGRVKYRYDNKTGAAEYSTIRNNLTLIPGAEPVELDETVIKPPKPRKVPTTSILRNHFTNSADINITLKFKSCSKIILHT